MNILEIDKNFLGALFEQAMGSPLRRHVCDLHTSPKDAGQRALCALLPSTVVPIHRHKETAETVIALCGKLDVVLYEEIVGYESIAPHGLPQGMDAQDVVRRIDCREVRRLRLCPAEARYGCQIPKGVWYSVEVIEPCVIFETKDGAYGEDGSELLELYKEKQRTE